ncbi:MAG TPA: adenylate/guanylate cyclase domain-containing protein [Dongiaceae bacterium]|nr:adenylate/guanylate cyclase domain-containing protein [Dongiaceae bacterium]
MILGLAIGWWQPGATSAIPSALEGRFLDVRHVVRGPKPPPSDFVIIAIDDKSMDRLERYPLPRGIIAAAIDKLTDLGAKVVAVDLLLFDRELAGDGTILPTGDAALARALMRNPNVILAASQKQDAVPNPDIVKRNNFGLVSRSAGTMPRPAGGVGFRLPIDSLASIAHVAHVNLLRDADGGVRRMAFAMPIGETDYLPAMPVEVIRLLRDLPRGALRLADGESVTIGDLSVPVAPDNSGALNHYGAEGTFRTFSLVDLLDGHVLEDQIAGRAIFIGPTYLGSNDIFASPFGPQLPGVEALATVAANIETNEFLRRNASTVTIDVIVAGLLGVLAFSAANMGSLGLAGAATLILWLVTATGLQIAFSQAYLWLDATTYVFTLAVVGLVTLTVRIVQQRRISGHLMRERDNLARYHSPLLTEWLAAQQRPSFNERSQSAAVMFVDVAGFTRRSEHLGPTATVGFLRDLHGRIERAALAHRGVIEQFMGDGAMIIFGLPEPAGDDAVRCLAAAQQLIADLGDWNLDLKQEGAEPVRLRFGLHYGPVMAALLGGERQGQITVAGDTVNVASRLQEMGKEHAAIIVASAEFVASVRDVGRADLLAGMHRLTGQTVRGRDEVIDLWIWR